MRLYMTISEIAREVGGYKAKSLYNMHSDGRLQQAGVKVTYPSGRPVIEVASYLRFIKGGSSDSIEYSPLEIHKNEIKPEGR